MRASSHLAPTVPANRGSRYGADGGIRAAVDVGAHRVPDTVADLRSMAIARSLRPASSIADAIQSMGFVQYDPIRCPARAQDLILAQRVEGYRAGDLDRDYASLRLEEGHFHVYGAMPPGVLSLLHPRCDERGAPTRSVPSGLEAQVLATVQERGQLHPRDARALLGAQRTRNAWGGTSAATTRALEALHHQGLLRVAHRDHGTKVYEPAVIAPADVPSGERSQRVALLLAGLLAPVPERTLREVITQLRRRSRGIPNHPTLIEDLCRAGQLDSRVADGVHYLWPPDTPTSSPLAVDERVRFLAPFDPLVWDRRRFAHLWGWSYRFEAYTPTARRRFGYYALPMLWNQDAVGWANCVPGPDGSLRVEPGFVERRPRDKKFSAALEREIAHLRDVVGDRMATDT
jgi:uncharacterized protein YcaQ